MTAVNLWKALSETQPEPVTRATREPITAWRSSNLNAYPRNYTKPLRWPDPYPGNGIHNGYSKFYNISPDGESYLAHIGMDSHFALFRDGDCTGVLPRTEYNGIYYDLEPRWLPDNRIIYHDTHTVYAQSPLDPIERKVIASIKDHPELQNHILKSSGGESDVSDNGRYYCICAYRWDSSTGASSDYVVGVVDVHARKILPGLAEIKPGAVDISPDGKWLFVMRSQGSSDSRYPFYDIEKLKTGVVDPLYLDAHDTGNGYTEIGHNGWACNAQGRSIFVYQDNRDDWFKGFSPVPGEVSSAAQSFRIAHMQTDLHMWDDNGGNVIGQHPGRMSNPAFHSCAFMSTYHDGTGNPGPYANHLIMIDFSTSPTKLIDLGHSGNVWYKAEGKTRGYFSEAFANITRDCRRISYGSNHHQTTEVQLVSCDLPVDWLGRIRDETPQPLPGIPKDSKWELVQQNEFYKVYKNQYQDYVSDRIK